MSYVSFPVDLIFSSLQTFDKFIWGMFNTWTVFKKNTTGLTNFGPDIFDYFLFHSKKNRKGKTK